MKKSLIKILIFVLLGIFFFPKYAGNTCGFCKDPPAIHRTEYGCIGLKLDIYFCPGICMDSGKTIICFGVVTSEKKCYTLVKGSYVEIPSCTTPSTWQEILDICPDCYYQASIAAYCQNDSSKAIEICGLITSIEQKNGCISNIARLDIEKKENVTRALEICGAMR